MKLLTILECMNSIGATDENGRPYDEPTKAWAAFRRMSNTPNTVLCGDGRRRMVEVEG